MKLVIVESPTKAKTIRKFLGKEYRVEASMGHVRDLPASADQIPKEIKGEDWARIGVDVEHGFTPVYIVQPEKKKVVADLKKALEDATELFVATDEDREGESIGWHLVQVLKPKVPIHRMVFHEITEEAIKKALASPRAIDEHLVQAQETRRVLDRLVGYIVSPLLWKKVKPKLSAGRVQSVAVRLLVLRERERVAFVSGTYWDVKAQLEKSKAPFESQLVSLGSTRLATGKDFDETTGKVSSGANVLLLSEDQARELEAKLKGKPFKVASVETRSQTRSPSPPFTTSTLQQEANRKLGLSARRTMQVAQRLYENGFITYMRTDSTNLSEEAITASRSLVERKYGREFLSEKPRQYTTKSKGAQEAHEAIRPAGTLMPTADELKLDGPEHRVYDMIW
ncbi:MAG: type I DNA topoisomerase, partial [Clostridia bacterium]|nr:type I DNA topoisomerase [Deltaproteobacteria bacterium]